MSTKLSSSLERQQRIWQQNQEKRRRLLKRAAAATMATALLAARLMAPMPAVHAETAQLDSTPTRVVAVADLDSDEISDEATDGISDSISDEDTDGLTDGLTDEDTDEDTDGISDYNSFDFSDEFSDEDSDERPFMLRGKGENLTMLRVGKHAFFVNDERARLDAPPFVDNGRTLLPLKFVAKAMGGTVDWNAAEQKVTITKGTDLIELWIGSNVAMVNGVSQLIDPSNNSVKAIVVPGANRTMVPLKFVAEEMGAKVFWDQDTKTITIKY